ncbi:hypothetical protein CBF45_02020 [Bordetella sp. J329]|nr:hypothetical protein CBF45_02020 [Bordetella sp. J329]
MQTHQPAGAQGVSGDVFGQQRSAQTGFGRGNGERQQAVVRAGCGDFDALSELAQIGWPGVGRRCQVQERQPGHSFGGERRLET